MKLDDRVRRMFTLRVVFRLAALVIALLALLTIALPTTKTLALRRAVQRMLEQTTIYLPFVGGAPKQARFAVIGDYGVGSEAERDVAALVASWNPDFIITTGDNNYPTGAADTIDQHIGQYYHAFIFPYTGQYGAGAATARFFPALGNHDWMTDFARPYLDYFSLPGNERYYDVDRDIVHLFALDSDPTEPDGVTATSAQAAWLQQTLASSQACWNIVYMHHPPFSSGPHGSAEWMQWPYQSWGADAVLAGHDHTYERIIRDGLPYFVNGLGGHVPYQFGAPVAGSEARYNADHGAMLVEAIGGQLTFRFITRTGATIDTHTVSRSCP